MNQFTKTQNFYQKVSKWRVPILIVVALLTILFSLAAFLYPKVVFNPNLASLIPKVSNEQSLSPDRADSDYLVVAIQAKEERNDLFSPTVLNSLQKAMNKISKIENLSIAISPFEQIKLNTIKRNGKVITAQPIPIVKQDKNAEVLYPISTMEEAQDFKQNLLDSPISNRLVINQSGDLIAFMIDHKNYPMTMEVPQLVRDQLEPFTNVFDYHIAGLSSFEESVAEYLMKDLILLMGIGLIFILIIFYFSFFSIRAIVLPCLVGLIGTIWMLGSLAILGIELSVVCIVCPPLVLALSSSYCIHALNQYYREDYSNVPEGRQPIFYSISQISPTIFSATLTTVIALAGLYISKITQTMDFGISVSLGITYCALLALFLIPSILSFLPLPSVKRKDKINSDFFAKFFHKSAPKLIKFRYLIFALFLIAVLSPIIAQKYMKYDSDYISYFPQNSKVVQETALISKEFSGVCQVYIDYKINDQKLDEYIQTHNLDPIKDKKRLSNFYYNEELLNTIKNYEAHLYNHKFVAYLLSFPTILSYVNENINGETTIPSDLKQRLKLSSFFNFLRARGMDQFQLISPDAKKISTIFRIADQELSHGYVKEEDFNNVVKIWKQELKEAMPPYVDAEFDGYRIGMLDLRSQMNEDLTYSTLLSLLFIFIIVTLIFKNFFYGLYALIPTIIGITLNFTIMAICQIPLDMTTLMVTSAIIGIGVDDSIHFLLNFRKIYAERNTELPLLEQLSISLTTCLEKTGRPIILTSLAIVLGMSTMLFSTFKPIGYFGSLIALSLVTTTIGCLFFLPIFIVFHYTIANKFKTLKARRNHK